MTITRSGVRGCWWTSVGCTVALLASVAQGDVATAPPTPTTCTDTAEDRTLLHRETEHLRRMPRVRNWMRADALLDQAGTVCELAARACSRCAGDLATRARSLQPVCQEATRPIWTAIGLERDIRDGRRDLRRLSADEQDQAYGELVGGFEHQQQVSLREHAQMMLRLDNQIAALEAARAQALHADRLQTELASNALVQVQLRLRELTTLVAETLEPPAPAATRGRRR